ncbi:hypothetical protein N658DRAFT_509843 [Parathielavia hyrcaniae]|uniref:Uncharacterized protein n=1 Tax=Parathielavia hyrcaniae TaxID=113614 RepID=A0AAN6PXU0_9PEZI|nr:hypothetical protein N658DRAFT_509843 [Parathielavia hyrcaniae]
MDFTSSSKSVDSSPLPPRPAQTGLQPRKSCFKPSGSGAQGGTARVTFSAEAHCVITGAIVKPHSRDRLQWEAETKGERRQRRKQLSVEEYWEREAFPVISNKSGPADTRFQVDDVELENRKLCTQHNTKRNTAECPVLRRLQAKVFQVGQVPARVTVRGALSLPMYQRVARGRQFSKNTTFAMASEPPFTPPG